MTINVRHFGGRALPKAGVTVLTPGALVSQLPDRSPDVVLLAVRHLAHRWVDPPRTAVEVARDLAVHPSMAPAMRRVRALLSRAWWVARVGLSAVLPLHLARSALRAGQSYRSRFRRMRVTVSNVRDVFSLPSCRSNQA